MHSKEGLALAELGLLTACNLVGASHHVGAAPTFDSMPLSAPLVRVLQAGHHMHGCEWQCPLMQRMMPKLVAGQDLLVQAPQSLNKWW